ncbi:helix-turn-helix transcriptional regulator [Streptomyces sp. MMCC 100]|uniref:helix-turn-helix transcriptional regulator n=1 Tax=Streptomyces sp. MMCC 100 TaxID=3163555 RepID=UPI0035999E03
MSEATLTPAELAAELGVSTKTLMNWRWQGTGPRYVKLTPGRSGRIRYRRRDVNAWLVSCAAGAAA